MKAAIAGLLVTALAWLPLKINRSVGAASGWLIWATGRRSRRFSDINLRLAFPDMPTDERNRLVRNSLIETGKSSTESAWLWKNPTAQAVARMSRDQFTNELKQIRDSGRGTLLVTPHAGAWEASLLLASGGTSEVPYFYRPPRDASFEPLLLRGRSHLGGVPLKLDASGIRRAIKLLRAGDMVGILPDQEPDRDGGVFAPCFGVPTLTMTLISRLARSSDADVLYVVAERTPDGWQDHAFRPDKDISDIDPVVAATAVNKGVERCVAIVPDQYLWSYRRFRELPDGGRRKY